MTEDHDAEMDGIVGELMAAGLVEEYTDAEGRTISQLTREGKAVGRHLAMTQGEDEQPRILNELLGEE